jgi:predicted nuclease of predicted toxin-antitoxin system
MRFLLDQGLPRSTVKHLADAGVTAEHVADIGVSSATDTAILEAARNSGSIVVTLDADFHQLLAASGATTLSVVRIRIEGLKGDRLAKILLQVLARAGQELATAAAISVTRSRIRVRMLPIAR